MNKTSWKMKKTTTKTITKTNGFKAASFLNPQGPSESFDPTLGTKCRTYATLLAASEAILARLARFAVNKNRFWSKRSCG